LEYRELLWLLAVADLKARHRQAALGMIWALAQPVAMMVVFTVVFSIFIRVPVEGMPYAVFAYIGYVSWLFFANALSAAFHSIVANMNLVAKAGFPREVVPLSKVIMTGFDFVISFLALGLLLVWYRVPVTSAILLVPVIMMIHVLFITGLSLLGAALYALWRDLGSLLPLILQLWMFLSPIVYPTSLVPEPYRFLYMLNPMAAIIEAYRATILQGAVPPLGPLAFALALGGGLFLVGYLYFKSVELEFADVL
jgi:lipopolysaccharide transport system permease protein